jgi:hypothetical protein
MRYEKPVAELVEFASLERIATEADRDSINGDISVDLGPTTSGGVSFDRD